MKTPFLQTITRMIVYFVIFCVASAVTGLMIPVDAKRLSIVLSAELFLLMSAVLGEAFLYAYYALAPEKKDAEENVAA